MFCQKMSWGHYTVTAGDLTVAYLRKMCFMLAVLLLLYKSLVVLLIFIVIEKYVETDATLV